MLFNEEENSCDAWNSGRGCMEQFWKTRIKGVPFFTYGVWGMQIESIFCSIPESPFFANSYFFLGKNFGMLGRVFRRGYWFPRTLVGLLSIIYNLWIIIVCLSGELYWPACVPIEAERQVWKTGKDMKDKMLTNVRTDEMVSIIFRKRENKNGQNAKK